MSCLQLGIMVYGVLWLLGMFIILLALNGELE